MRTSAILPGCAAAAALALLLGCGPQKPATPEPACTAESKTVECWWVLYGCTPELSPRDACLALCKEQEKGQLRVCEGKLPHRPDPVMMSIRYLGCDRCLRFSDQPFQKAAAPRKAPAGPVKTP
jgi:hypothetical protein